MIDTVLGKSTLVDKETGRIYWEGGASTTLSSSILPKIGLTNTLHLDRWYYFRSTLLSSLLFLAVARVVSDWLASRDIWDKISRLHNSKLISLVVLAFRIIVELPPKWETWFVGSVVFLYLLEAYLSPTRQYLVNSIPENRNLDDFLDHLKVKVPVVEWRVRSFDYRTHPAFLPGVTLVRSIKALLKLSMGSKCSTETDFEKKYQSGPAWFRRKHIQKEIVGSYSFDSVADATVAGIWKRSAKSTTDETKARLAKIVLSKVVVLADEATRQEYFRQQNRFVDDNCSDKNKAEFSTSIHVKGYKSHLLANRPSQLQNRVISFMCRLETYWLFTFLGLTVPYRIWFNQLCDEIRVTVVKEVSSKPVDKKRAWATSPVLNHSTNPQAES